MRVCFVRELTYPVIKIDGIGPLIYKISDYLFRTENSSSCLLTRGALGVRRLDRRGNLDICRIGLEPPRFLMQFKELEDPLRRFLFAAYSGDARFLFSSAASPFGISAMRKLAEEAEASSLLSNVDVFHCQGIWTNFETFIGLSLARRFQKPLIFQIQGHVGTNPECMNLDQRTPWYDPVLGWKALNQSKVIICGNKSSYENLKLRTANKVKITFIPTCIDTKVFNVGKDLEKQEKRTDLLFVARLTTFKDPITPLRAMKIVARVKPEAKLKIVGGGPLLKKIRLLVRELQLERNVILTGVKSDTRPYYRESKIFLAMSPVENFLSNSLLEAMASGLVIIATDVGETRNIIRDGKNGVLVPPSDPETLASAILSLLSDENLRHDLSRNALETVKDYDLETVGPKYVRLYKEVMQEV